MYRYNPFGKDIGEISAADLGNLTGVPEGWYIEYKREIPNGRSISKSISAFANTYGGWLFYGVDECQDGSRTAGLFLGIDSAAVANAEQAIRQAASSQISPTPTFFLKLLHGPCEAIGLAEGRTVILVGVPSGNSAPYVHSSGVIYRRVADSSEPRPETDRHFLDLLWQRGKQTSKTFEKFVRSKPKKSKSEDRLSSVRILLFPDPWGERSIRTKMEFETFSSIMKSVENDTGGIPFDNIFSNNNGYTARQIANNHAAGIVFSWRYYFDCVSEITIPLNSFWVRDTEDAAKFLDGYAYSTDFVQKCLQSNLIRFEVVDVSQLYSILVSVLKRKKFLMDREELSWNIFYKIQINEFWRRVPYIDIEDTRDFIRRSGIPISQEKTIYFPTGRGPDACHEINIEKYPELPPREAVVTDASIMFLNICSAIGYPISSFRWDENDEEATVLRRLSNLGTRASEVTSRRSRQ
jgi:hypothetical protein